jgi:hypothetical protein
MEILVAGKALERIAFGRGFQQGPPAFRAEFSGFHLLFRFLTLRRFLCRTFLGGSALFLRNFLQGVVSASLGVYSIILSAIVL